MLDVSLLCSSEDHPVYEPLRQWMRKNEGKYKVSLCSKVDQLVSGDLLFLVACSEIVKLEHLARFKHALVLHASDLPTGRGWSPYVWDILNGADRITLTLLEADKSVDTGRIWKKVNIPLNGTELSNEIQFLLSTAQMELLTWACENFDSVEPVQQEGSATYYKRRHPDDSRLDPHKTIAEQFNLLRVCDQNRYPSFFEYQGCKYIVKIEKSEQE